MANGMEMFLALKKSAVCDDQRQRVLVLGADVDEVNVQPVDLGYEVR